MHNLKYIIMAVIIVGAMFSIRIESSADEIVSTDITGLTTDLNAVTEVEKNTLISNLGFMSASWYGPKFHGKLTANGEVYNQMAYTAAHKSMPFGTMLKITNLDNDKSVIVRINDRGPFIKGRDIDLSKGAAQALNSINEGVIKVKVEKIEINDSFSPFVYR